MHTLPLLYHVYRPKLTAWTPKVWFQTAPWKVQHDVPTGCQMRSPVPQLSPAVKFPPELGFPVNPPYPWETAGQVTPKPSLWLFCTLVCALPDATRPAPARSS
jgi:hypothetical protein